MKLVRLSALAASLLVLAPPAGADELVGEQPTLLASHVTFDGAEQTLLGALPVRPEDVEGALPKPPTKVTLENSYAPVIFSHAGHLSRRTACKACHGPGPITKIGRFQPKVAHETCRNCHLEAKRGPTACAGCHHKKAPPVTELALAPGRSRGQAAPGAAAAGPVVVAPVFDEAAAARSYEVAAAWPAPPVTSVDMTEDSKAQLEIPYFAPRRTVWAGGSVLASSDASPAPAVALGVNFRQDGWQISETLEWSSGGGGKRAIGLVGGGIVLPVHSGWTAHVLGVGGFDAFDITWTSFLPALGARAGVEWTSPRLFVHSFDVSVTALADLTRGHDPSGVRTGGMVFSLSVSAGLDVTSVRRR